MSDYDNLTSVSQQQHRHVPLSNSIPAGQLHMGTAMHASTSTGGGNVTIATPSTAIPSSSNALVPAGAFPPGVIAPGERKDERAGMWRMRARHWV